MYNYKHTQVSILPAEEATETDTNTRHRWKLSLFLSRLCLPVDMIPENALEEMTKNMDPNLVIVEAKDGVLMK